MQLSLIDTLRGADKRIFLDVFARVSYEPKSQKPYLMTIEGQLVPSGFRIRCPKSAINQFPEGTIYKLDVKLVKPAKRKNYFSAVRTHQIQRALEFFDYNLRLQQGKEPGNSAQRSRVIFLRK